MTSFWRKARLPVVGNPMLIAICACLSATSTIAAESPQSSPPETLAPSAAPAAQSETALRRKASREQNELGVREIRARHEDLAEQAFRKALKYDPDNITAVFNLAGIYLNSQRNEQAIKLLERYTSRHQENADLFVRLGDAYFTMRREVAAEKAYEQAYALVPDYHGLPLKLATLYGLRQDFGKAEQMLEQATAQSPNNAHILNNLGNIYILNGKASKAVDAAKQAIQLRTSRENYLTLGNAYEAQHDYENSLIAFERARDLGENRPELMEKIEKLRKSMASRG